MLRRAGPIRKSVLTVCLGCWRQEPRGPGRRPNGHQKAAFAGWLQYGKPAGGTASKMRYLLGFVAAVAVSVGIGMLGCPSVSFSGAYRTVAITCLPKGSGDIPGWLAGTGLVAGAWSWASYAGTRFGSPGGQDTKRLGSGV